MSANGSTLAVYSALSANTVVTVAKLIGFGMTGSGTMLSEAVHSLADVGNQALLAIGMKRAETPPDDEHPMGYGREAFVWSMVSAVGMFFLGCGVSLTHGINALMAEGGHAEHTDHSLNITILLFAFVIEAASCGVAVWGLMREAKAEGQTFITYLKTTDDPFGVAVLLEDTAAVVGVMMALTAVGLTAATGNPNWDAYGSIAIGLLLGFVAVFLISKNRTLLVGRAIRVEDAAVLSNIFEQDPAVEHIAIQQAVVTGTNSYSVRAEIDFDGRYLANKYLAKEDIDTLHKRTSANPDALKTFLGDYGESLMELVGDEIDRIEAKILVALPKATQIDIEPD